MKNFIFGVLGMLLVGSIALNGYFYMQKQKEQKIPTPIDTPTKESLVGGDKDIHGCIGSAGYTWCETKNKCLRVWEEKCESTNGEPDAELIKKALYQKNKWDSAMPLNFDITVNDGTYAGGSISGAEGGGYWYAKKVNGNWEIVVDGNGMIKCDSLAKYPDYPKEYVVECYDSVTGKSMNR